MTSLRMCNFTMVGCHLFLWYPKWCVCYDVVLERREKWFPKIKHQRNFHGRTGPCSVPCVLVITIVMNPFEWTRPKTCNCLWCHGISLLGLVPFNQLLVNHHYASGARPSTREGDLSETWSMHPVINTMMDKCAGCYTSKPRVNIHRLRGENRREIEYNKKIKVN